MAKLRYNNDDTVVRKLHVNGTIVRSGEPVFRYADAHKPCGSLVKHTKRGLLCTGCGIITPNVNDVIERG